MKSDIQGISQCSMGEEEFEAFELGTKRYLQYDYRSLQTGKLFSGIFMSLDEARKRRGEWLEQIGADQ